MLKKLGVLFFVAVVVGAERVAAGDEGGEDNDEGKMEGRRDVDDDADEANADFIAILDFRSYVCAEECVERCCM